MPKMTLTSKAKLLYFENIFQKNCGKLSLLRKYFDIKMYLRIISNLADKQKKEQVLQFKNKSHQYSFKLKHTRQLNLARIHTL